MSVAVSSLLIKPAGPDCNLACEYCFYSGKAALFPDRPVHRMSLATVRRALSQYLPLAGPSASVGFQGGEPTLCGADFFGETLALLDSLRQPGQQVSVALQTNGMLLDETWAELLRKHNVLVGLSVDGPAGIHDAYRKDFAGAPTHARVTRSMALLREAGVPFNTLTVVTRQNVARGRELFEYLSREGGGYMQFIPCVEAADGAIAGYTPDPGQYAAFLTEVFDCWYDGGQPRRYVRMFDEMLIAFMEYRPPSCSFGPRCAANLVVEHDGSVYPCDFFVEPCWYLGNIHDRELSRIADDPLLAAFVERKSQTDTRCQSCPWLPLCWGDCPKYRLSAAGQPAGSSYYCESYRRFFAYAQPKLLALKQSLLAGDHPRSPLWRRLEASVGRNDPCPCQSGRKFKRCCQPVKRLP